MSYNPENQISQKKLGTTAIWIGFTLIAIALARIFILPALMGPENEVKPASAPQASPQSTEIQQTVREAPATPRPNEIDVESTSDTGVAVEIAEVKQEDTNSPVEAPPQLVLKTYFAQVRGADGAISDISITAANEDRVREIIRDFRGNPEILQGPTLEVSW